MAARCRSQGRELGGGTSYWYTPLDCLRYRAKSESWLRTQATNSFAEVKSSILLRKNPVSSLLVTSEVVVVAALTRGDAEGVAVAPPERDEQESEWADVLQGEMKRLRMK